MTKRIVIVGGGIVGLATAWRLRQRYPDARVTVLEKEAAPAQHQSSHNGGVLHACLYYKTGSHKVRLAVRGIRRMVEFCAEHAGKRMACKGCAGASEWRFSRGRAIEGKLTFAWAIWPTR